MAASISNTVNENPHGGFVAATWNALLLFGTLGILTLSLLALAYFGKGPMRSVGFSTDPNPVQIVIGNDVYSIPENMVRHRGQRTAGISGRVELIVHWPSGEGYSPARLAEFASTDPDMVNTVLIGLSQRHSLLDMQSRFRPALSRALVDQSVVQIAGGLFEAELDAQYGFIDETLVYSISSGPGSEPAFVARCQAEKAEEVLLHPCELDSFVGVSGVARVRFERGQLNDWRSFQLWLDRTLKSFLLEAG
ncbi:MAG: hypothetical protein AAFR71_08215 [Pseudomonadota bacterium]